MNDTDHCTGRGTTAAPGQSSEGASLSSPPTPLWAFASAASWNALSYSVFTFPVAKKSWFHDVLTVKDDGCPRQHPERLAALTFLPFRAWELLEGRDSVLFVFSPMPGTQEEALNKQ